MLLRNRFLSEPSFGAMMAAETEGGAGGSAPAPSTTTSSSDASTVSPPPDASGTPGLAASVPGAADSATVVEAPASAPAANDSATSLLAEAAVKPPGEAEAPKPDAKPEGEVAAKPDAKKPAAEKPAPAKPKADAKPDAAKPAAEAKPAEGEAPAPAAIEALAETPPAPRTYEPFTLPEGLKLNDERVKTFTTLLDDGELSHQDRGQKLIDLFVQEVSAVQKARDDYQREVWEKYQNAQREELRADSVVGGNRMDTALGRAKWVLESFFGSKDEVNQLLGELSYTGMGNNVRLVRGLDRLAEILSEGEMVPATARPPKGERGRGSWYPSMNGNASS